MKCKCGTEMRWKGQSDTRRINIYWCQSCGILAMKGYEEGSEITWNTPGEGSPWVKKDEDDGRKIYIKKKAVKEGENYV